MPGRGGAISLRQEFPIHIRRMDPYVRQTLLLACERLYIINSMCFFDASCSTIPPKQSR